MSDCACHGIPPYCPSCQESRRPKTYAVLVYKSSLKEFMNSRSSIHTAWTDSIAQAQLWLSNNPGSAIYARVDEDKDTEMLNLIEAVNAAEKAIDQLVDTLPMTHEHQNEYNPECGVCSCEQFIKKFHEAKRKTGA